MSSIASHTTRAAGTILTAAIYNEDHLVHITNAETLNTDKVEQDGFASLIGLEVIETVAGTHETLFSNPSTHADADSDVIIISGTNAEMHIFAKHADSMTYFEAFDGGIAFDTADADLTVSAGGNLGITIDKDNGQVEIANGLVSTSLGIGYGVGAGGTVTQGTDKSTTVELNEPSGEIVMHGAQLNANTAVTFQLTNSRIAATDVLIVGHKSVGTLGTYQFVSRCAAGSATISVKNVTAGNLSEAIILSFAVIKGAVT